MGWNENYTLPGSISNDDLSDAVKGLSKAFVGTDEVVLPYAGSSGHSGSDTSAARAEHEDSTGVTGKRQRRAMYLLDARAARGMTWSEFASAERLHHGQASSVLSNLHKAGRIVRLNQTRFRSKVYVLPEWVKGREVEPYRANKRHAAPAIDAEHVARQMAWSRATFGPGTRTKGVLDHIRKELIEVEADPFGDEWVDVIILAFDGAWRHGWQPEALIAAIKGKQVKNEQRQWPDWRTASQDHAIEHVRTQEES
jgi:hypothetical protein